MASTANLPRQREKVSQYAMGSAITRRMPATIAASLTLRAIAVQSIVSAIAFGRKKAGVFQRLPVVEPLQKRQKLRRDVRLPGRAQHDGRLFDRRIRGGGNVGVMADGAHGGCQCE